MKSWLLFPVVFVLLAGLSAAQTAPGGAVPPATSPAESSPTASAPRQAAQRSLALGVNLLTWDNAQPDGGWTRWAPRPELAPGFGVDRAASSRGVPALRLSGANNPYVLGGWRRTVTNVEPHKAYRFHADVEAKGVPSVRRNIICQIRWIGADLGVEITPEYVNNYAKGQGYSVALDQTFSAPDGASAVEVSILVQWVPTADLMFRNVTFETAVPEPTRLVKLATVYWRPEERSTPEKNVEAFCALIDKLGPQRPDVILLPEAATVIGTGLANFDAAQEMPGPAFFAFAAKAKQYHCYIIYGAYEKVGNVAYNSAFIIARDGTLAGAYRKVQLPVSEVEGGLSPGDFFKTFQLDFAKIGILICHDTAFGEAARVQMLDGAEIIFVPIWGGDLTQLRARAMDNGLWLVTSGYDVPSAVIDPTGEIVSMTWKEIGDGTVFKPVDLARKFRRPWIGDWHNAVIKQRRTDAYQKLVED